MRKASVRAPVTFMIIIRQFRVTGEICCAKRILHAEGLSCKVSISRFVVFCLCICTQRRSYVSENTKHPQDNQPAEQTPPEPALLVRWKGPSDKLGSRQRCDKLGNKQLGRARWAIARRTAAGYIDCQMLTTCLASKFNIHKIQLNKFMLQRLPCHADTRISRYPASRMSKANIKRLLPLPPCQVSELPLLIAGETDRVPHLGSVTRRKPFAVSALKPGNQKRQVLRGSKSRRRPETHRQGQPLHSEARSAKNAPESAICGVLPDWPAPTGSVLWLVPISNPRSAPRRVGRTSLPPNALRLWRSPPPCGPPPLHPPRKRPCRSE